MFGGRVYWLLAGAALVYGALRFAPGAATCACPLQEPAPEAEPRLGAQMGEPGALAPAPEATPYGKTAW